MLEISRAIKEMSEIELPPGLHGKIMRRLLFLKFRTPFVIVVVLLLMNLAVSMERLFDLWENANATTILLFSFTTLEFSVAGIRDILVDVYEVMPVGSVCITALNLFLVAYAMHFPVALRKIKSAGDANVADR